MPSTKKDLGYGSATVLLALGLSIALACLWRFTPLHERLDLHALLEYGRQFRHYRLAPLVLMGIFFMAGLVVFPHGLLIWAVGLLFPPIKAILFCEVGSLVSGFTSYTVGRLLREDWARRVTGSKLEHMAAALKRRGVLTIVVLHIFPIAPYSVLNLAAGMAHISVRDFTKGTVLGVTPGILIVCLLGWKVLRAIHHPAVPEFLLLGAFLAAAVWTLRALRHRLAKDAREIESSI